MKKKKKKLLHDKSSIDIALKHGGYRRVFSTEEKIVNMNTKPNKKKQDHKKRMANGSDYEKKNPNSKSQGPDGFQENNPIWL